MYSFPRQDCALVGTRVVTHIARTRLSVFFFSKFEIRIIETNCRICCKLLTSGRKHGESLALDLIGVGAEVGVDSPGCREDSGLNVFDRLLTQPAHTGSKFIGVRTERLNEMVTHIFMHFNTRRATRRKQIYFVIYSVNSRVSSKSRVIRAEMSIR